MISTSVSTTDFSQIIPEERFNVDAPSTNPLLAASSLDVTRTEGGLEFSAVEKPDTAEPLSVERTLEEIITRCKRDVEVHPQSTRSKLNLALALMNGGHSTHAAGILNEVIKAEPMNYVALTSLGLFYFNHAELMHASEIYLRLHSAYPKDPAPLINLASVSLREEDFVGASSYLEKAVGLDGCSAMAKYLLAMVMLRLGKNSQAIALLRASIRDGTPSAELNQGLAIAYLASGDLKRSERAFLTALAINSQMASAVHGLAILHLHQHRFDEAVELLLDHLSRNPNDLQARKLAARAYVELRQFSRARGQLSFLVPSKVETKEERTERARVSNNIGFCFAHEGKTVDAESWLKQSISLDGTSSAAPYTNLTRLFLSQGRFKEALAVLTRLDNQNLTTPDSTMLRGAVLVNLLRFDEAIEILQMLINTRSAPVRAYADLGWLLAEQREQYDAALAVLKEAFERDPSNNVVLNNLAYVHLTRGEPGLARAILDQIKNFEHNSILLTATRGLLLLWEGDIAGGEELYKKSEALAFQSGQPALGNSIRQKRHLEMARAYLRSGQISEALREQQSGLSVKGGYHFNRFVDQLSGIARQLNPPQNSRGWGSTVENQ